MASSDFDFDPTAIDARPAELATVPTRPYVDPRPRWWGHRAWKAIFGRKAKPVASTTRVVTPDPVSEPSSTEDLAGDPDRIPGLHDEPAAVDPAVVAWLDPRTMESRPSEEEPAHDGPTLDPDVVLARNVREIGDQAYTLAADYDPASGISMLFALVSSWFGDLWSQYRNMGTDQLTAALAQAKAPLSDVVAIANERTLALRVAVKSVMGKRLMEVERAKPAIDRLRTELRKLAIGIVGNPELPVLVKSGRDKGEQALVICAVFAIALMFDVIFNSGLLRYHSNKWVALAFSFAISVFGGLSAFWAGKTLKAYFANRNARVERDAYFVGTNGTDPETGIPVQVFPLPADTRFNLVLSHVFFGGICLSVILYRWALSRSLGDLGGSIGFVVILVSLYVYELIFDRPEHPRAAEYVAKKTKLDDAEATLAQMSDFGDNPDLRRVWTAYDADMEQFVVARREQSARREQGRELFLTLVRQVQAAPDWFAAEWRVAARRLVRSVGETRESSDELDTAFDEAKPEFVLEFPFELEATIQEMEIVPAEEDGISGRLARNDFDNLIPELWEEVVEERKQELETAAETTRQAAIAAAERDRAEAERVRLEAVQSAEQARAATEVAQRERAEAATAREAAQREADRITDLARRRAAAQGAHAWRPKITPPTTGRRRS